MSPAVTENVLLPAREIIRRFRADVGRHLNKLKCNSATALDKLNYLPEPLGAHQSPRTQPWRLFVSSEDAQHSLSHPCAGTFRSRCQLHPTAEAKACTQSGHPVERPLRGFPASRGPGRWCAVPFYGNGGTKFLINANHGIR